MATRRYAIDLIVNQQTTPPAPTPPPNPNTPPAPGSQASIDGLAKYISGVYALRQAWGLAKDAMQEAVDLNEKLAQNQKTAAEKSAEYQRNLRQYFRNEGVFTDPSKRGPAMAKAEDFNKFAGFKSETSALEYMTKWSSDVSQYKGLLFDKADDEELMRRLARSTVLSGIGNESGTRLASAVIGSTNWLQRYGPNAKENINSKFERIVEILTQGKGDINLNTKNFSRYANEMISVYRDQGRIKDDAGQDNALEKAAILMREVSEYNADEAEVFGRNAVEMLRQFGKPSVAKHLKKAGVLHADDPFTAIRKLNQYYAALRDQGKVKPGETIIDFMRNAMKGNIRSAAGVQAIMNAEEKDLGTEAMARIAPITPATVKGLQDAMAFSDTALALDQTRASVAAESRAMGMQTIPLETVKSKAVEMFLASGYGGINDPRWPQERGIGRGMLHWMGGEWVDYDQQSGRSDYAQYMLMKELAKRNHPGTTREQTGFGGFQDVSNAQREIDNFWAADSLTRDRILKKEIGLAGGESKVVDLLQKIIDEIKKSGPTNAGVPLVPQQPGLVRP